MPGPRAGKAGDWSGQSLSVSKFVVFGRLLPRLSEKPWSLSEIDLLEFKLAVAVEIAQTKRAGYRPPLAAIA
jgi:hypothetical protein